MLKIIDRPEYAYEHTISDGIKIARSMFKKARLLPRPTLARRDAPWPGKVAESEEAIVLFSYILLVNGREL